MALNRNQVIGLIKGLCGGGGGSSGDGNFIVNIAVGDPLEEPTYSMFTSQFQVASADKTFAEMQAALDAGKQVIVRAEMGEMCIHMPIILSQPSNLVFSTYSQGQSFGVMAPDVGDWGFGVMKTLS